MSTEKVSSKRGRRTGERTLLEKETRYHRERDKLVKGYITGLFISLSQGILD